jgi:CDP-4-dehydro-6-deoxyglucose reductase, E3
MSDDARRASASFPTVKMLPSGNRIEIPPGTSILQAALSAGVYVPYGCNNGTCGDCAARVISGDVEVIKHSDYVMDVSRKQLGFKLLCCCAATRDTVVEVTEVAGDSLPQADVSTVRLQKLEPLGPGSVAVKLRCMRSSLLRYVAGQQVELRLPGTSPLRVALASCPCEGLNLELHLDSSTAGAHLHALARMRRNDETELYGPLGGLELPQADWQRALLLVAVDTQFAAIQSLLAHLINIEYRAPIRVLWQASDNVGHYRANYLRALADSFDDMRCRLISPGLDSGDGEAAGESIAQLVEDLAVPRLQVIAAAPRKHPLLASLGARAITPIYC